MVNILFILFYFVPDPYPLNLILIPLLLLSLNTKTLHRLSHPCSLFLSLNPTSTHHSTIASHPSSTALTSPFSPLTTMANTIQTRLTLTHLKPQKTQSTVFSNSNNWTS
ncbi:hypothetical protein HanXRQr2_Chr12g0528011 [Helianthus annuus]|uniref:Uncharacterized protein n=1 Tax=Helianthus annuus TaxID=4232 RepID=A0A9K3HDD0_HELAN|nr:hypothetical protein HanXRQr2_Chr12g0528011 [Helianthus annuus]KAJ0491938.1 hypothetical protein HanIR_Chr12g0569281 [Helianthus annuus]